MTGEFVAIGPALDVEMPVQEMNIIQKAKTVEKRYGKSTGRQAFEALRLALGPGKLTMSEYYSMRLFDDAAFAGVDKRQFLGLAGIQRLIGSIQGMSSWLGPLNDKVAFAAMMGGLGLPVPKTKAVFATNGRMNACATLHDTEALVQFLSDPNNYPMFSKPVAGTLGVGAMSWKSIDLERKAILSGAGSAVPISDLAKSIVEAYAYSGYQFQEQLVPHSAIREICGDRLATVRIVTVTAQEYSLLGAEWKVPAGANVVDNFKHQGNILAELDTETGTVRRAIRGTGLDMEEITAHPDTGRSLVGFQLPHWQLTLDTVKRAARLCDRVPILGWDVALTDDGCVLIEANTRPDLRGLQSIMRCGFYQPLMQVQTDVSASRQKYKRQQRRKMREEKRNRLSMALEGKTSE